MQYDVQQWLSSNQIAQPVQVSKHVQVACYTRQSITEGSKMLLNSTAGGKSGAIEFTQGSVKYKREFFLSLLQGLWLSNR